jgi:hypothetical protein
MFSCLNVTNGPGNFLCKLSVLLSDLLGLTLIGSCYAQARHLMWSNKNRWIKNPGPIFRLLSCRVARWFVLKDLGTFGSDLEWKMLVYFMALWIFLRPMCIFCVWPVGKVCGKIGIFCPVLFYRENLATLFSYSETCRNLRLLKLLRKCSVSIFAYNIAKFIFF